MMYSGSVCVSSAFVKMEEEAPINALAIDQKQGIVTILGSDFDPSRTTTTSNTSKKVASLRRALSADMSSKQWLAQNGLLCFSPMKKIASSEELAAGESSEAEEEQMGQDEIWRSIHMKKEKEKNEEREKPEAQLVWSSILSQKNEDTSDLAPPYIHPLVKRSTSSLSEKSLEICTESLGSETGSDGFSSYPCSEIGDIEEDGLGFSLNQHQEQIMKDEDVQIMKDEDVQIAKYKTPILSSPVGSFPGFPPPLTTISRADGTSVHMQSSRRDGRLVLEAVAVPPRKFFLAKREHGRLVLTMINRPGSCEAPEDDGCSDFGKVFGDMEEEIDDETGYGVDKDEEEEEEEETEYEDEYNDEYEEEEAEEEKVVAIERNNVVREHDYTMEQNPNLPNGIVTKVMKLGTKNSTWASKFNKSVNLMEEVEQEKQGIPIPQSLPPRPPVARLITTTSSPPAAASLNAYEYFWRSKKGGPGATSTNWMSPIPPPTPPIKHTYNKVCLAYATNKAHEEQEMVMMKGMHQTEYFVPSLRGCKEPKRSVLFWEPHCIATS